MLSLSYLHRMLVKDLPFVLTIHLKRFEYDPVQYQFSKRKDRIVFPLELKLPNTVCLNFSFVLVDVIQCSIVYHVFCFVLFCVVLCCVVLCCVVLCCVVLCCVVLCCVVLCCVVLFVVLNMHYLQKPNKK